MARDRERWMTVGEVAALTGMSDDVIRRACEQGQLTFTRIPPGTGSRWIDRESALRFQAAFLPSKQERQDSPE